GWSAARRRGTDRPGRRRRPGTRTAPAPRTAGTVCAGTRTACRALAHGRAGWVRGNGGPLYPSPTVRVKRSCSVHADALWWGGRSDDAAGFTMATLIITEKSSQAKDL